MGGEGVYIKVAQHSFVGQFVTNNMSFTKSWQEKDCSSQTKTWQVNNVLMREFD